MFTITALLVLFTAYLLLTLLSHGGDRFLYPRLVLLLGLVALAVVTLAEKLLYA